MKKLFLLTLFFLTSNLFSQGLKTKGKIIVDKFDNEVILQGYAPGGWLVMEGYYDVEFLSNDLKIGWSINNLTDKLYFDHMSRLKTMGIHEMGRNISVGINYQF